jgi:hypothetical protein
MIERVVRHRTFPCAAAASTDNIALVANGEGGHSRGQPQGTWKGGGRALVSRRCHFPVHENVLGLMLKENVSYGLGKKMIPNAAVIVWPNTWSTTGDEPE